MESRRRLSLVLILRREVALGMRLGALSNTLNLLSFEPRSPVHFSAKSSRRPGSCIFALQSSTLVLWESSELSSLTASAAKPISAKSRENYE